MAVAAMGDGNGSGTTAMSDSSGIAMDGGTAVQSQWQWAAAERALSYWALSAGTAFLPCIGQNDVALINNRIFLCHDNSPCT
jgi:hypothetical protein